MKTADIRDTRFNYTVQYFLRKLKIKEGSFLSLRNLIVQKRQYRQKGDRIFR